jgi:hypothetical protein
MGTANDNLHEYRLLRTLTTETPGTFSDDPDWGGDASEEVPFNEAMGVPRYRPDTDNAPSEEVSFYYVQKDTNGAILDRGASSIDVQGVYQVEALEGESIQEKHQLDSVAVTGVPSNRPVLLTMRGVRQFTVRCSSITVDGTTTSIEIWARIE